MKRQAFKKSLQLNFYVVYFLAFLLHHHINSMKVFVAALDQIERDNQNIQVTSSLQHVIKTTK